jgi:hypothetical protein
VIRFDEYLGPDSPMEHRITVKKIVWSHDIAVSEVQRLNELKRDKGCYYFWQYTRIDPHIIPDTVDGGPTAESSKEGL